MKGAHESGGRSRQQLCVCCGLDVIAAVGGAGSGCEVLHPWSQPGNLQGREIINPYAPLLIVYA